MITIQPASFPRDLDAVRRLFQAYADGLGVDLGFQGFAEELATLPGKYAPPAGRLLIARRDSEAMACVALRPVDGESCEMKRLYVQPGARGDQLGRRLAERICQEAREAGYARICLDTLSTLNAAVALYRSLGFKSIAPYVFNPHPDVIFLGLDLHRD